MLANLTHTITSLICSYIVQLDEASRALLMKMLDDATQQTLLKQAKVIYFRASNCEKASFALHFLILCSRQALISRKSSVFRYYRVL